MARRQIEGRRLITAPKLDLMRCESDMMRFVCTHSELASEEPKYSVTPFREWRLLVFIMSAVAASLASSACRASMRALNVATTS